jgi:hypothetical protein
VRIKITALFLFLTLSTTAFSLTPDEARVTQGRIQFLNSRIPAGHPRVLILRKELPDFRNFITTCKTDPKLAYLYKNLTLDRYDLPLIAEPERLPAKKSTFEISNLWRKGYSDAFTAGSIAQHYAFSYLVTRKAKYAREAARWLVHLSAWDLHGGIDIKNNDEAFIQHLRPMILAYDWVNDGLTPEERKTVAGAISLRMKILFAHVTSTYRCSEPVPIEKNNSHKMRFISIIGLAGLAFYHELPEAPTYLAWAYEYYRNVFPAWGGKDGGYSEGLAYWQTGHNQHFMFLDAMLALNLTELFQRDYYRNNGYFALYNVLPYPFTSFGDLCRTIRVPNEMIGMHLEKYALINHDGYLARFRELISTQYPSQIEYYNYSMFDSIFQLYRKGAAGVEPQDLKELPRSRVFYDVGWVAFHSELGSKEDVMLGFKSSPYGSASHSLADQNSFVLNGFGDMLAVSTGYREWYGSPHHYGYTKQTLSQNAVLFGGKGQMINDANAKGKITRFYTGPDFDFATGDARAAYAEETGVKKDLRNVLFVNRQYFVIFDELETVEPLQYQWLLHARERMTENRTAGEVEIHGKHANLLVRFVNPGPAELCFHRTDQFAVPVDEAFRRKMKNEWHFTAETVKPQTEQEWLTVLFPYQKGTFKQLKTSLRDSKRGVVLESQIGASRDLILLAKENERTVEGADIALKGKAGVISEHNGNISFALMDGNELKSRELYFSSSHPVSAEGEMAANQVKIHIAAQEKTRIQMKVAFAPVKIEGIAKDAYQYDRKTEILELEIAGDRNVRVLCR